MNEQKAPGGIEWTRVSGTVKGVKTTLRGFTTNPGKGCRTGCGWLMPDGQEAICYAKAIAETTQMARVFPHGYEYTYWNPEELKAPPKVKESAGIFWGSMADLFEPYVPPKGSPEPGSGSWSFINDPTDHPRGLSGDQIREMISVMKDTPQHIHIILTKNAPRLAAFEFPPNVWIGFSVPATYMFGHEMTTRNRRHYMIRSLEVMRHFHQTNVTWLSAEPLSFDMFGYLDARNAAGELISVRKSRWWETIAPAVDGEIAPFDWCVVGAASKGSRHYQPDPSWVDNAVHFLHDHRVKVFFKGNLRSNEWVKNNQWLQEFPLPRVKCIRCGDMWHSPICPACSVEYKKPQEQQPPSNQLSLF